LRSREIASDSGQVQTRDANLRLSEALCKCKYPIVSIEHRASCL